MRYFQIRRRLASVPFLASFALLASVATSAAKEPCFPGWERFLPSAGTGLSSLAFDSGLWTESAEMPALGLGTFDVSARLMIRSIHQPDETLVNEDVPARWGTLSYGPLELIVQTPAINDYPIEAVRLWVDGEQAGTDELVKSGESMALHQGIPIRNLVYRWNCPPLGRHFVQATYRRANIWSVMSSPVRFELRPPTRPEIIGIAANGETPQPLSKNGVIEVASQVTLKLAEVRPGDEIAVEVGGKTIAPTVVDANCCTKFDLQHDFVSGRYRLTVRAARTASCGITSEPSRSIWIDLYNHETQVKTHELIGDLVLSQNLPRPRPPHPVAIVTDQDVLAMCNEDCEPRMTQPSGQRTLSPTHDPSTSTSKAGVPTPPSTSNDDLASLVSDSLALYDGETEMASVAYKASPAGVAAAEEAVQVAQDAVGQLHLNFSPVLNLNLVSCDGSDCIDPSGTPGAAETGPSTAGQDSCEGPGSRSCKSSVRKPIWKEQAPEANWCEADFACRDGASLNLLRDRGFELRKQTETMSSLVLQQAGANEVLVKEIDEAFGTVKAAPLDQFIALNRIEELVSDLSVKEKSITEATSDKACLCQPDSGICHARCVDKLKKHLKDVKDRLNIVLKLKGLLQGQIEEDLRSLLGTVEIRRKESGTIKTGLNAMLAIGTGNAADSKLYTSNANPLTLWNLRTERLAVYDEAIEQLEEAEATLTATSQQSFRDAIELARQWNQQAGLVHADIQASLDSLRPLIPDSSNLARYQETVNNAAAARDHAAKMREATPIDHQLYADRTRLEHEATRKLSEAHERLAAAKMPDLSGSAASAKTVKQVIESIHKLRLVRDRLADCQTNQANLTRELHQQLELLKSYSGRAERQHRALFDLTRELEDLQEQATDAVHFLRGLRTDAGRRLYQDKLRLELITSENIRRMEMQAQIETIGHRHDEKLAESAEDRAKMFWARKKLHETAATALRRTAPDTTTRFHGPAHFPIPRHGYRGLDDDRGGVVIREGMKLTTRADGGYDLEFEISRTRLPAELHLQIHFQSESEGPWNVITLAPEDISAMDVAGLDFFGNLDPDTHWIPVKRSGQHPALRLSGGRIVQARRQGRVRYGYGFRGLGVYDNMNLTRLSD